MKNNKGFTFLEIVAALFICSIILVVLLPNLINQYYTIDKMSRELTLKEVLYEELLNNRENSFYIEREDYVIRVGENYAEIINKNTNEKVSYEQ